jgi:hypothetical protein
MNFSLSLILHLGLSLSLGSSSHWNMRFSVFNKHGGMYVTLSTEIDALRKLVVTRVAVIQMFSEIP